MAKPKNSLFFFKYIRARAFFSSLSVFMLHHHRSGRREQGEQGC